MIEGMIYILCGSERCKSRHILLYLYDLQKLNNDMYYSVEHHGLDSQAMHKLNERNTMHCINVHYDKSRCATNT